MQVLDLGLVVCTFADQAKHTRFSSFGFFGIVSLFALLLYMFCYKLLDYFIWLFDFLLEILDL